MWVPASTLLARSPLGIPTIIPTTAHRPWPAVGVGSPGVRGPALARTEPYRAARPRVYGRGWVSEGVGRGRSGNVAPGCGSCGCPWGWDRCPGAAWSGPSPCTATGTTRRRRCGGGRRRPVWCAPAGGRRPGITVSDLLARWFEAPHGWRPSTVSGYASIVRALRAGLLAERRAGPVTPQVLQVAIAGWRLEGIGEATVAGRVRCLRSAFG